MYWMLTPLDNHSDGGFGAMGGAFKESAEMLLASEKDSVSLRNLPICFLLRHAAELFLKSALVVLHRRLSESEEFHPAVPIDGKPRSLTSVHDLLALYSELVALLTRHESALAAVARTKWLPLPDELNEAIGTIHGMDARGVFFRYPTPQDNSRKSSSKLISPEQLASWNTDEHGLLKALVVLDQNDQVVGAFQQQQDLLEGELEALKVACHWLSSIHVGLRVELADGW